MSWTTTPRGAGSVTSSLLDGLARVSEEGPRTMSQTVSLVRFTLTQSPTGRTTESPAPSFMTKGWGGFDQVMKEVVEQRAYMKLTKIGVSSVY